MSRIKLILIYSENSTFIVKFWQRITSGAPPWISESVLACITEWCMLCLNQQPGCVQFWGVRLFMLILNPAYHGRRTLSTAWPFFCRQIQVGADTFPVDRVTAKTSVGFRGDECCKHEVAGDDVRLTIKAWRIEHVVTCTPLQLPTHTPVPTDRCIGRSVTPSCPPNAGLRWKLCTGNKAYYTR